MVECSCVVENTADEVNRLREETDECSNAVRCLTEPLDCAGGGNSALHTLIDKHVNALPGPVHIWCRLPVDFEEAPETVTAIDDYKCTTGAQNETTTVLFYHIIQQVEGADTGDDGDGHRTLAVIKAMILKGLIHRNLVVLLYVMEGMGNFTDLTDALPHSVPLVICTVESLQRDGRSVVVVEIRQEKFVIDVVLGIGLGVVCDVEGVTFS